MPEYTDGELKDRLSLIERMITEGRRETESWGWMFVLWGFVYYVALAWSMWARTVWAWPITVCAGVIVSIVVIAMRGGDEHRTTLARAVGGIWVATGISMFLLFLSLGVSGRLRDEHIFVAVISGILGLANGASGLLLRWKVQLGCAVVWWAAAVVASFANSEIRMVVFLLAIFLCQIAFGIYSMTGTQRRSGRAIHA